jgi:c(7)-type cytochrome triheme protein
MFRMPQKKRERVIVFIAAAFFISGILYACVGSKPVTVRSSQTGVTTIAPPVPPPIQAPPEMSIEGYTGDLGTPNALPEPGPPYAFQNSNAEVVLKEFPKDAVGNVDWVKAFGAEQKMGPIYKMGKAIIQPHESLDLKKPGTFPFPFDIPIPAVGSMPDVIFPHFPHTFWLDCANCHPDIFIMKKGSNPISMVKIVNGEFCGRCHGRVAFTLSNCTRCHVKPKG